jgi:hypothetical protein
LEFSCIVSSATVTTTPFGSHQVFSISAMH